MTVPAPPFATHRLMQLRLAVNGKEYGWIAAALICAAYIAVMVQLTSFPMQDYPNHVARAAIMADILFHHGAHFGHFFEVHLAAVPYILPDLILTSAVEVFGPDVGAGVFTSLVLLALPSALLFYAYVTELPWNVRLIALMAGLYLSTDWFFQMGFFAFRLGVALVIVDISMTELLRRRWSLSGFVVYVVVLIAGYLTHLSALVFTGVAIGATGLVRLRLKTTAMRREIWLLGPIAVLLVFYAEMTSRLGLIIGSWGANREAPTLRHLLGTKIRGLSAEFAAFDWHLTLPTLLAFIAIL